MTGRLHNIPPLGWIGGLLFATVALAALLAPLLTSFEPQALAGFPFQEPNATHWLGTDDLGHDIFSQLIYGARLSLLIGLLSAFFAVSVGLAVALTASYFRGVVEVVLMRLVDITLAFPFLPLVIVLAAFLGRTISVTVLTITAVLWARPALILWVQAAKIRQFQHVTSATAMGASPLYIMARHMLPRLLPLATPQFVRTANVAIFLEAAMAFLGVGDPNRVSWGTMLYFANAANAMLLDAWLWWILPVGLALTATIVGLAYMGHALESWSDPRLARRQAKLGDGPPAQYSQRGELPTIQVETALRQPIAETGNDEGGNDWGGNDEKAQPDAIDKPLAGQKLVVKGLTVWYDDPQQSAPVVAGVNFAVGAGKIVGLVGDSGCGKSTVVMSLLSLQQSSFSRVSGGIWLRGQNLPTLSTAEMLEKMPTLRGREIALVPQNAMNALNPVYTVLDQIVEAAQLAPGQGNPTARAHEILTQVGIPAAQHRVYPHELSGGMRQRVVIGMAVVNKPSFLIADEPTTGLDVVTQSEVIRLLLQLRDELGMAILLVSHDRAMVAHIADEVLVMQSGRIIERNEYGHQLQ